MIFLPLQLYELQQLHSYYTLKILKFKPDILFSVDSPDFTLRVAKLVKEKNSKIKIIHFIAPIWSRNL